MLDVEVKDSADLATRVRVPGFPATKAGTQGTLVTGVGVGRLG